MFDSSSEHQHNAIRKFFWRWFGPYVMIATHNNATYTLCELKGTVLKISIVGKRIKVFRRRDRRLHLDDIVAFDIDEEGEVKTHNLTQREMEIYMKMKMSDIWHILEDMQV